MDTSGFYRLDGDQLLCGPNFVYHRDYSLMRDNHTEYTYPVDGWYWFDSEQDARAHFDLPQVEEL